MVIAAASNAGDESICCALAADRVVNHQQQNRGEAVLAFTGGERVDRARWMSTISRMFGVRAGLIPVFTCLDLGHM